jgi:hypothetical protein
VAINKYFGNLSTLAKRGVVAALFGSMTALLVSCGGSGTTGGNPLTNGTLSILPNSGSLYANVPVTLNVAGGIGPYFVTSNEQTVMPLNFTLTGNTFTTVPNQPGVVDPQTDVNVVPSRTVILTARDSTGTQTTATFNVLQNFLTGYGLSISTTANCAAAGAGAAATEACAGADSLISLVPISNGLRYANKQMRFTANFGAFSFILDSTGITGPTVTSVADTAGGVTARIRVTPNAATQYAQFRMTDVATGAYRDFTFVIKNANGGNTALSALPASISLGGATTATCGTGLVNVFAFGGLPPYTAATTFPNSILISPPILSRSGDAFSVQIFNANFCLSPGNVVITDAAGNFVTIDVTTTAGTAAPLLPLAVAPSTLCVPDGGTGVVSVSGGNNNKVINSSNPGLATALPTTGTGNFTTTISSLGAGGAVGTAVILTVSDGANSSTITVTRKTTCP